MMSFFEIPRGVLNKIDCFSHVFIGKMINTRGNTG